MPTFENLESLASVRAKINNAIQNADTALSQNTSQQAVLDDHETRIDTLELGGGGGATNLTWNATTSTVVSDTGTDATLTQVDGTNPGLMSVADKTKLNAISGTNTGDQTSIVGITGTKAQFDTAVTDGNIMYVGDAPTAHTHTLANVTDVTMTVANLNTLDDGVNTTLHFHDADRNRANHTGTQLSSTVSDFTEAAQDAVGAMVDGSLTYVDATPLLQRAALTGHITASAGSNVTTLGSFTKAQLDTAVSDGNVLYVGDVTTNANHTGDATGATALTLATVNSNVGSFGLAGSVAQFAVNAKGLITSAANVAISIASTAISDATTAGRAMLTAATAAAQTALLDVFTSGAKGLAPASGGGTTNFLRADGTWSAPSGGGGSPGGSSGEMQYNNAGAFAGAADVEVEGGQLKIPAISTPTAPASDGVKFYGKRSGRALPAFLGPSDQEVVVQPMLARQHVAEWYPQGNGTTVVNLGLTPSFTGTATTQNVATTSFYTMCKRIGYLVTVAATTAVANWRMAFRAWTIGGPAAGRGGFTMTLRFGCSTGVATSTTRLFAGFRTDGNTATDVNPSSIPSIVCFGWDSGDANAQIIHRGAGAATKIDLGASFSRPSVNDTDVFEVILYSPPGTTQEVYYEVKRLNTGAVANGVITTNLPTTSTFGNADIYYSVGGTSSVIGLSIMKVSIESNF